MANSRINSAWFGHRYNTNKIIPVDEEVATVLEGRTPENMKRPTNGWEGSLYRVFKLNVQWFQSRGLLLLHKTAQRKQDIGNRLWHWYLSEGTWSLVRVKHQSEASLWALITVMLSNNMCKRVLGPSNLFVYAITCLEVWHVYPKVARTMSSAALVKNNPFAVVQLNPCAVTKSFQNYHLSCLKVKYDVKVKGKTADQNSIWYNKFSFLVFLLKRAGTICFFYHFISSWLQNYSETVIHLK